MGNSRQKTHLKSLLATSAKAKLILVTDSAQCERFLSKTYDKQYTE